MASTYTCRFCGWKQKPSSFYRTTEEFKKINEHDKNCPKKPKV